MGGAAARPLTGEEVERLQASLVEHMERAECMPLDMAHGFLTATAALPDVAGRDAALLDRVLGQLHADAELRELLHRFHVQLLVDLRGGEYGPLILQVPRDDGSVLPLPYGWCRGYVAGMDLLSEQQREQMFADEQAAALLAPVLSFLMYEEEQWFEPPKEAAHREAAAELGPAAVGLFTWWRGRAGN